MSIFGRNNCEDVQLFTLKVPILSDNNRTEAFAKFTNDIRKSFIEYLKCDKQKSKKSKKSMNSKDSTELDDYLKKLIDSLQSKPYELTRIVLERLQKVSYNTIKKRYGFNQVNTENTTLVYLNEVTYDDKGVISLEISGEISVQVEFTFDFRYYDNGYYYSIFVNDFNKNNNIDIKYNLSLPDNITKTPEFIKVQKLTPNEIILTNGQEFNVGTGTLLYSNRHNATFGRQPISYFFDKIGIIKNDAKDHLYLNIAEYPPKKNLVKINEIDPNTVTLENGTKYDYHKIKNATVYGGTPDKLSIENKLIYYSPGYGNFFKYGSFLKDKYLNIDDLKDIDIKPQKPTTSNIVSNSMTDSPPPPSPYGQGRPDFSYEGGSYRRRLSHKYKKSAQRTKTRGSRRTKTRRLRRHRK